MSGCQDEWLHSCVLWVRWQGGVLAAGAWPHRPAGKQAGMQASWLACRQAGWHAGKLAGMQASWLACRQAGWHAGKLAGSPVLCRPMTTAMPSCTAWRAILAQWGTLQACSQQGMQHSAH
jgi:hypothetical protein